MKDELIAFGITPQQCFEKAGEHAEIAADLDIAIQSSMLDMTHSQSEEEMILFKGLIEDLSNDLKKERYQIRKWMNYYNVLTGRQTNKGIITDTHIQIAKDRDMLQLVSEDIDIKKKGSTWMGPCPFHNEEHGSLMVKDNTFYCFGCGEAGDTISWLTKYRGMKFTEAVRFLN